MTEPSAINGQHHHESYYQPENIRNISIHIYQYTTGNTAFESQSEIFECREMRRQPKYTTTMNVPNAKLSSFSETVVSAHRVADHIMVRKCSGWTDALNKKRSGFINQKCDQMSLIC